MIGSFAMVNRNPYLTGSQKLVQARMYAQGATLSVLLASFAFETADAKNGKGRWETIKILDPNDPTHKHMIEKRIHHERYAGEDQWRGKLYDSWFYHLNKQSDIACLGVSITDTQTDMVEAEEAKINARKAAAKAKQHETESEKPSKEPQTSQ